MHRCRLLKIYMDSIVVKRSHTCYVLTYALSSVDELPFITQEWGIVFNKFLLSNNLIILIFLLVTEILQYAVDVVDHDPVNFPSIDVCSEGMGQRWQMPPPHKTLKRKKMKNRKKGKIGRKSIEYMFYLCMQDNFSVHILCLRDSQINDVPWINVTLF